MRYASPTVAGLAALFLATATAPGVPSSTDVALAVIPSVLRVQVDGAYGSGSVISSEPNGDGTFTIIILTAKHVVVDELGEAAVPTVMGYQGKVLSLHGQRDIALVEVQMDFGLDTIPGIRMEPLTPGEKVYGFGYSLSRQMWVTEGITSAHDRQLTHSGHDILKFCNIDGDPSRCKFFLKSTPD